jgi:hypothetical protein
MKFDSQIKELKRFAEDVSNDQIKNEIMFFNSDIDFAWNAGGPITRSFIDSLPEEWLQIDTVLDSRVHMLMPGWYPAIPGFHHDDVPRPPIPVGQHFISAGQPDYINTRYHSEHICGLVNADICPTQFAIGSIHLDLPPEGELIYRTWHPQIVDALASQFLDSYSAPDRTLVQFDWQTFHTGTKAISNGWRWFGRVTRKSDRCDNITNEIRHQTQVYLEFPMEGW